MQSENVEPSVKNYWEFQDDNSRALNQIWGFLSVGPVKLHISYTYEASPAYWLPDKYTWIFNEHITLNLYKTKLLIYNSA